MNEQVDLVPLFTKEFELCKVRPGELVALLTDSRTRSAYIAAAGAAAAVCGAKVFEVSVPSMGDENPILSQGMGQGVPALAHDEEITDAVFAALSKATFIVDLVSETIIHVPIREKLRAVGARILTIVEPADCLERMMPNPEIRRFVKEVGNKIANARTLRISSAHGTDLTYQLDQSSPAVQYGYADEPGRWDHWPSALATAYPVDGSAQGIVVLSPGDVLFPFLRYVQSEATLTVVDGYIRKIEGGPEAQIIQDYLDSWEDPEVFAVSHVGVGLHPRADWSALDFYPKGSIMGMDARSFLGGFIFSTGPNRHVGREVDAHLDMPLRGCVIELDGEELVLEKSAFAGD